MLANIITLVSGCVTFLGGFLVVWGAVSLGLAIREQQGGSQIASAISTIAGVPLSSPLPSTSGCSTHPGFPPRGDAVAKRINP